MQGRLGGMRAMAAVRSAGRPVYVSGVPGHRALSDSAEGTDVISMASANFDPRAIVESDIAVPGDIRRRYFAKILKNVFTVSCSCLFIYFVYIWDLFTAIRRHRIACIS
jgi:hypothetical protein